MPPPPHPSTLGPTLRRAIIDLASHQPPLPSAPHVVMWTPQVGPAPLTHPHIHPSSTPQQRPRSSLQQAHGDVGEVLALRVGGVERVARRRAPPPQQGGVAAQLAGRLGHQGQELAGLRWRGRKSVQSEYSYEVN